MTRTPPVMTQSLPIDDGKDMGVTPSGSGHQPSASAADASSRSGVPNAGHTPGPWGVNCSHIYAPDGAIIATVRNPGSRESDYPLVANRNLMAAAPLLLEALEWAIADMRGVTKYIDPEQWHNCMNRAEAAISSARGGQ